MRFDVLREHKEGAFWQYTPDNQEFVGLAKLYAKKHSAMSTVSETALSLILIVFLAESAKMHR